MPPLRPGMELDPVGDGGGSVHDATTTSPPSYDWDELRFSVSWKAYCFADAEEQATWRTGADDLTLDVGASTGSSADLRDAATHRRDPTRSTPTSPATASSTPYIRCLRVGEHADGSPTLRPDRT